MGFKAITIRDLKAMTCGRRLTWVRLMIELAVASRLE